MVTFAKDQLPNSITTVEGVLVWAETVLQYMAPELTVVESSGGSERAIMSAPFFITAASTPGWRNIGRSSIALGADWRKGGKLWEHALPLTAGTIPTEFRS